MLWGLFTLWVAVVSQIPLCVVVQGFYFVEGLKKFFTFGKYTIYFAANMGIVKKYRRA